MVKSALATLGLVLTPHGRLLLYSTDGSQVTRWNPAETPVGRKSGS